MKVASALDGLSSCICFENVLLLYVCISYLHNNIKRIELTHSCLLWQKILNVTFLMMFYVIYLNENINGNATIISLYLTILCLFMLILQVSCSAGIKRLDIPYLSFLQNWFSSVIRYEKWVLSHIHENYLMHRVKKLVCVSFQQTCKVLQNYSKDLYSLNDPSNAEATFVQRNGQGQDFWKPSKPHHVGIHWIS